MTVREFAKHTGLSECCVRKLLREEKVFYMKIGSRYYINAPRTIDFLTHNPIMDITWKEPVASVQFKQKKRCGSYTPVSLILLLYVKKIGNDALNLSTSKNKAVFGVFYV